MFNTLTPDQVSSIKKEINQDDERCKVQLELLEKWMECHLFLPKNYEKHMLTVFLHSCKHDMEKTKAKLESYFINNSNCPAYLKKYKFTGNDWDTLNNFYLVPSENLTPEGYKVTFMGFREDNPATCDPEVICRLLWLLALWKANFSCLAAGEIIVLNINIFSLPMATRIFTPMTKHVIKLLQDTFPFRSKKILIINVPSFAKTFVNVFKVFLSDKIKERVIVEKNDEIMQTTIPEYCIPRDLGGSGKPIKERMSEWLKLIEKYEEWFSEQGNYKINESYKPVQGNTSLGIDASSTPCSLLLKLNGCMYAESNLKMCTLQTYNNVTVIIEVPILCI